jgi:outer membrane protein assembly factor BamB
MSPRIMSPRTKFRRAMSLRALSATGIALALVLGGCSHGGSEKKRPRTPVFGQRTSILSGAEVVNADETLAATPVLLPDPVDNADWPQSGGDASKSLGGVTLGDATKVVWRAQISGGGPLGKLASPPVVSGGKLFVIDTDAVIHAFDAESGKRLWDNSIGTATRLNLTDFGGGVSAEGERIFASTGVGDVVALEAATGKVLWTKRPGGPLRGSPTVSNGNVYVMSQDNQIFALSETDGAVVWQDTGTLQTTGVFGVASPAAAQGSVIAGFSSGELSVYRYENGRVLWGDSLSRTNISTAVSTLTDIDADPVIDRGRVFAIGEGGRMASYELVSGQRLWELNIGGIATPVVAGEWVFVVTDKGRLYCIARTAGKVRWIADLGGYRNPKSKSGPIRWYGPVLAGGKLILVSTDGEMAFVDPAEGKVTQKRKGDLPMSLPPIVADKLLYVLTDNGTIIAYK